MGCRNSKTTNNNKKKSYSYSSIYSTDTDDANPELRKFGSLGSWE